MANHNNTHHTLISNFIVGNLHADVTPEQVYKSLGLDKFPCQYIIEVHLAVNKSGRSKGYAFLQIPRSCTSKLLKLDNSEINGQTIYVCRQEGNSHMTKDKKWVKSYKDHGMAISEIPRPKLIYKYKPARQSLIQEESVELGPLWDMCAELSHKKFASDVDKIVAHCYKLGVCGIVIPGRCHSQRVEALDMIRQYDCYMDIYLSTGIGPQHANKFNSEEQDKIEQELSLIECRCMGPIGLDCRLTNVTSEEQLFAFEEQVKLACAKQTPLYLVEHEAHDDFVAVLTKYNGKLPKCAIIDFTGNLSELQKYVSMGFYIVITGSNQYVRYTIHLPAVITDALQKKLVPTEKILLSSNAPKKLQENFSSAMGNLSIPNHSCDKLSLKRSRLEPLGVFLTLQVVAKYLEYKSLKEIQEFGKTTVKNSKLFLGLTKARSTDKKNRKKGVNSHRRNNRKINTWFVIFALSVLVLALLLEYISGLPNVQVEYLTKQTLF